MNDNKLIAEFMGAEYDKGTMYGSTAGDYIFSDGSIYLGHELKYHTSWDWLMPVVEKIEGELEEEFRVVTLEHECSIHQKTEDQKLQDAFQCVAQKFGTSKIEATYNAVVEFIKAYNNGKQ